MTDPSVPSLHQTLNLVDLPIEIQTAIYGMTITHSSPIKPELWLPGESTFAHDRVYTTLRHGHYLRDPARIKGQMPEALFVVDLVKTCRMIHSIVNGFYLFYRLNRFEFRTPQCMLDYLKALPTKRRQAIKDVEVLYDYSSTSGLAPALTVLRSCTGLRHLTIDITLLSGLFEIPWATTFEQAPTYQNLIALRGLQSLTVKYGENGSSWDLILDILQRRYFPITHVNRNAIRFEIYQLQTKLNAIVTLYRPSAHDTLVTAVELAEALTHSTVIEGDILATIDSTLEVASTSATENANTDEQSGEAVTSTVYPVSDEVASWANDVTPATWGSVISDQDVGESPWMTITVKFLGRGQYAFRYHVSCMVHS